MILHYKSLVTMLVAVYLITNTLAVPKPKPKPEPEPQFILVNPQQNYNKEFWSNLQNNLNQNIQQFPNNDAPKIQVAGLQGTESSNQNYQQQLFNEITKNGANRNPNIEVNKLSSEFKYPFPKQTKEEMIVHRPSPIIINRKPTQLLINHEPVIVRPAPVVFYRSAQPVRPIIVHNPKPQPPAPSLRIQPVFVNVNRKKPNPPKVEYVSNGSSNSDDDWIQHILNSNGKPSIQQIGEMGKQDQPRSQYAGTPEDEILRALQSQTKNIYSNGDGYLHQSNPTNPGAIYNYGN